MVQTIEMVVTVKAYPSISTKYGETVCVAGIRTDTPGPEWVRLYPLVYRDLQFDLRFTKYQRITLEVADASDPRPESLKPNLDTLALGDIISTERRLARAAFACRAAHGAVDVRTPGAPTEGSVGHSVSFDRRASTT